MVLGATAAVLPRPSRIGWLATLDTLLRRKRRRIVRHWTQVQPPPGGGRQVTTSRLRGHLHRSSIALRENG